MFMTMEGNGEAQDAEAITTLGAEFRDRSLEHSFQEARIPATARRIRLVGVVGGVMALAYSAADVADRGPGSQSLFVVGWFVPVGLWALAFAFW